MDFVYELYLDVILSESHIEILIQRYSHREMRIVMGILICESRSKIHMLLLD